MTRNKSYNEERTSEALKYYYLKAKELGLIEQIVKEGDFLESAIRTAIRRGRISQKMLDSFVNVMGIDARILTGEIDLNDDLESVESENNILMSDEEMMEILQSILKTQNIGNTSKKKSAINTIKSLLNQF